jgi:hypothetical protein
MTKAYHHWASKMLYVDFESAIIYHNNVCSQCNFTAKAERLQNSEQSPITINLSYQYFMTKAYHHWASKMLYVDFVYLFK